MSNRPGRGAPAPDEVSASIATLTKKLKHMSVSSVAQLGLEFSRAHFDFEDAKASLLECVSILGSIQNVSSPVSRLPPEVLLFIFRLLQQHPKRLLPRRFRESQTCGWLPVTQVCRRWRIIAETHSELWATFEVDLHQASPDSAAEQIESYLERSGTIPLRIGINGLSDEDQSEAVVEALCPHLHRVEELTVCGGYMSASDDAWISVNEMLDDNELPRLRALHLTMPGLPPSDLDDCPSLESLALQGHIELNVLDTQSLRQLHLSKQQYKTWSDLEDLCIALQKLPQLEDLWFTSCGISMSFMLDDGPVPIAAVRIPQLHNLAFNGCNEQAIAAISGCFDMKTQEELALVCTVQDDDSPYAGLVQLLLSSLPLPSDRPGWKLHIEFRGLRSSITFTNPSCALRLISRDCMMWEPSDIMLRLAGFMATGSVKEFCLRVLPEPGGPYIALGDHPMEAVVDEMFDLVDGPYPIKHHFQLPELPTNVVDDYLSQKKVPPQTYHFYPSPGLVSSSEDEEMLEEFARWTKKADEGGINNVVFHTSGSPPQLKLPSVCTSSSKRCWTWPGWGPNAVFNEDGSDELDKRQRVKIYGVLF